ncbi:unnamed protein product, partial [Amoebophrya sp. A120]|eukprot:GSA120T00004528001.1
MNLEDEQDEKSPDESPSSSTSSTIPDPAHLTIKPGSQESSQAANYDTLYLNRRYGSSQDDVDASSFPAPQSNLSSHMSVNGYMRFEETSMR